MAIYYSEDSLHKGLKVLKERCEDGIKPPKEREDVEDKDDEEETEVTVKIEKEEKGEAEEEPEETEEEPEEVEEADEDDDEEQFAEWFNEEMKKYEFNEGLFDGIKAFISGVGAGVDKAKDVAAGAKAGLEAVEGGKGIGDILSIAGTTMKANKFKRAYKEMWLGFNKGLKMLNPKLQDQVSQNEEVRNSVNQLLGIVIDGLENGKIKKVAEAAQKVLPGTNPEQAEAKAQAKAEKDDPGAGAIA